MDKIKSQKTSVYHKNLSGHERFFSKIIHQSIVENTSDFLLETLFRSTAMYIGSVVLFFSIIFSIVISSLYGYELNYLIVIVGYLAGYLVGIIVEYTKK